MKGVTIIKHKTDFSPAEVYEVGLVSEDHLRLMGIRQQKRHSNLQN